MVGYSHVPHAPGCYFFKDFQGNILYIGKAKNLFKRVSQYFQKKDHDPKTLALVEHIRSVDFIVTANETESLVLESNLIKKHQPRYNISLKDSKRFAYLQITDEEFPRLVLARKWDDQGKYFGPFVSAALRNSLHEMVNKTFQLRTCKKLPKRACLRYHIGLCSGPCVDAISKTKYAADVKLASQVLRGKGKELIPKLKERMLSFSSRQEYEHALRLREQITALEYLDEQQNMERQKVYDEDIIDFFVWEDIVYLLVFHVYKGTLTHKQEYTFDYHPEFFEEFLLQYYSEQTIPKEIIVRSKVGAALSEYLSQQKGSAVTFVVPKQGDKKKLLDLVKKNIEISFFGDRAKVEELQKAIKLNEAPDVIECFDISHLSGTSTVASMVQFRNGKADKSNYRRFKIRTVSGIDDFASMKEVVYRRYHRLLMERKPFPNLVIIDGGKGQLSSAREALKELNVRLPVVALAKREEEIFVPGLSGPIVLSKKTKALQFLQEIRDEAHRFAISYNRLLRKKKIRDEDY